MDVNKTKSERKEQKRIPILQIDYSPKQKNYRITGRIVNEHDFKIVAGIVAADFMRFAMDTLAMDGRKAMWCMVNCIEDGLRNYGEGLLDDAGARPIIWPERPKFDVVKGSDYFERVDELIRTQGKDLDCNC